MLACFVLSRESLYNGVARFELARLFFDPGCSFDLARFVGEAAYDHRWGFFILKWHRFTKGQSTCRLTRTRVAAGVFELAKCGFPQSGCER
jgi:hypothetical protein